LQNFQIFVISLTQSIDRQARVKEELSKTHFDWAFLDATDGRLLPYPIPEYNPEKVTRLLGFELTPNEIGCFLSHKKAWESSVQNNTISLVFEDDFILLPHFEQVIDQLLEDQEQWELVRLQALNPCQDNLLIEYGQFSLYRNHDDPLGATAYLVNPKAAAKLIEHSSSIYEPLDHYLEHHQKHGVPMLAIKPYPVDISRVESTIADRPNDRKPIKGMQKRMRSINRQIDRWFSKNPWFPK
jgi:glycosyl transferase family 25